MNPLPGVAIDLSKLELELNPASTKRWREHGGDGARTDSDASEPGEAR